MRPLRIGRLRVSEDVAETTRGASQACKTPRVVEVRRCRCHVGGTEFVVAPGASARTSPAHPAPELVLSSLPAATPLARFSACWIAPPMLSPPLFIRSLNSLSQGSTLHLNAPWLAGSPTPRRSRVSYDPLPRLGFLSARRVPPSTTMNSLSSPCSIDALASVGSRSQRSTSLYGIEPRFFGTERTACEVDAGLKAAASG